MQENAKIDPEQLSGMGHAFYQPIDTAETAEAKSLRIEIILVPPHDFSSELLKLLQNVMESIEVKQ